jgi:tRNA-guanine transglycosylase
MNTHTTLAAALARTPLRRSPALHPSCTQVILGNTYHLGNRPGPELLTAVGGLHKFMNWNRGMLTDSGGFQMVSLLDLADITEEGVTFQSPTSGERMLLTPERSMQIQNAIGADILMALDDVVSSVHVGPERFEEATHRTLRWIDRCIGAHTRPTEQNLFAIVQGGLDPRLRKICLDGLAERDASLPGYAIGGLAGGEDKASFWRVVDQCTAALPANKPRYVMGVGYPLDIVVCSCLGADMYDCVYPTRTARFGTALVPAGVMRLKQSCYAADQSPIDPTCTCAVCKTYSRAYLHAAITREPRASHLVSYHNLHYMMRFTREMRGAITDGSLPEWVRNFVEAQRAQFPKGAVPDWVKEALVASGIEL